MNIQDLKEIIAGATEGLEPCPFCGGEAAFGDQENGKHWFVNCTDCLSATNHLVPHMNSKQQAAELWNTRAIPTAALPNALALIEEMAGAIGAATVQCDAMDLIRPENVRMKESLTRYEAFKADVTKAGA